MAVILVFFIMDTSEQPDKHVAGWFANRTCLLSQTACDVKARQAGREAVVHAAGAAAVERGKARSRQIKKVGRQANLVTIENGGAEGARTPGLMTASHALSQLSYSPRQKLEFFNKRSSACQQLFDEITRGKG
jgi:hypothetical protein